MKYSIDQIREMLGKISSWPWRANGGDGVYDKHGESIILNTDYNTSGVYERDGCQIKPPPNHTLIVNAPTIISDLLEELEAKNAEMSEIGRKLLRLKWDTAEKAQISNELIDLTLSLREKDLRKQLEEARKALEFYALKSSWSEEYVGGPRLSFTGVEGEGFEVAHKALERMK